METKPIVVLSGIASTRRGLGLVCESHVDDAGGETLHVVGVERMDDLRLWGDAPWELALCRNTEGIKYFPISDLFPTYLPSNFVLTLGESEECEDNSAWSKTEISAMLCGIPVEFTVLSTTINPLHYLQLLEARWLETVKGTPQMGRNWSQRLLATGATPNMVRNAITPFTHRVVQLEAYRYP